MKIDQRLHTEGLQLITIETIENSDTLLISVGEENDKPKYKVHLTNKEAIELSTMLKSMVDKTKSNSI